MVNRRDRLRSTEAAPFISEEDEGVLELAKIHVLEALTGTSSLHVTNGDAHDHSGGDGAQIDHGGLAGTGDDDHTQYLNVTRHDADDHSGLLASQLPDHQSRHQENGADELLAETLGTAITTAQLFLRTNTTGGTVFAQPDHGMLAGVSDDDHSQYLNVTRHDADDHSGLSLAVSLAASDNTGASTSSTTEVDVLTVSSLSIPAAHKITITGTFRVTSGGVSGAGGIGLKINSTTVYAAINVINIHASGNTFGSFEIEIPPHDGTYNRGGTWWGTGIDGEGTDFLWGLGINGSQAHLAGTAAFPNATTTSIAITGKVNNASQTLYFNKIRVYEWAD